MLDLQFFPVGALEFASLASFANLYHCFSVMRLGLAYPYGFKFSVNESFRRWGLTFLKHSPCGVMYEFPDDCCNFWKWLNTKCSAKRPRLLLSCKASYFPRRQSIEADDKRLSSNRPGNGDKQWRPYVAARTFKKTVRSLEVTGWECYDLNSARAVTLDQLSSLNASLNELSVKVNEISVALDTA